MTAAFWTANVPRPASVPIEQIHVMLYSFFPGVPRGDGRPYVWRLLAMDRIGLVSAIRPAASNARQVEVAAGITYEFKLTYKRTRNSGGSSARPDGSRRQRSASSVTINSMVELRERMIRFVGERGGAIGYVRLDQMRDLRLQSRDRTVTLPIVDAAGQVRVTDPAQFVGLLTSGGPGTGKAYGCGAWWIPSLMDAAG